MDVAVEIAALRSEIAELKLMIREIISPSAAYSIAEKAKLIREAHTSGDRAKIRKAHALINKGKR